MGSLDTQKILRYTAEIREAQGLLVEMTSEDIDQCSADPIKMRAMKYTLHQTTASAYPWVLENG